MSAVGRAFLLQVNGDGVWQWGRSFGNLGSGPSAAIYVADIEVVDGDSPMERYGTYIDCVFFCSI